jgi:hypothetical protein
LDEVKSGAGDIKNDSININIPRADINKEKQPPIENVYGNLDLAATILADNSNGNN